MTQSTATGSVAKNRLLGTWFPNVVQVEGGRTLVVGAKQTISDGEDSFGPDVRIAVEVYERVIVTAIPPGLPTM